MSDIRLTPERLAELQAMTFEPAAAEKTEAMSDEFYAELQTYLAEFIHQPDCICCGRRLLWRWTIQNGEGECVDCGYPVRVYHRPTILGEKQIYTRALQYQPKELFFPKPETSDG